MVAKQSSQSVLDGLYAQDDEEYVALASFHPVLPENSTESARCVKLVVDCSVSMSGDSIDQAKEMPSTKSFCHSERTIISI